MDEDPVPDRDLDLDVLTDLFDDSPDSVRRRTLVAYVASTEQRSSDADRRAAEAVLDGTFSTDDLRRVCERLGIAPGYLTVPAVTRVVDQRVTARLLAVAVTLTGVAMTGVSPAAPGEGARGGEGVLVRRRAMLEAHTVDGRVGMIGGIRIDPRAVSVTQLTELAECLPIDDFAPDAPDAPDDSDELGSPVIGTATKAALRGVIGAADDEQSGVPQPRSRWRWMFR